VKVNVEGGVCRSCSEIEASFTACSPRAWIIRVPGFSHELYSIESIVHRVHAFTKVPIAAGSIDNVLGACHRPLYLE